MPDLNSIVRDILNLLYDIPGYLRPILFIVGAICLTLGFKAYEYIIKLPGAILFGIAGALYGHETGGFFLAILYGTIGIVIGGAIAWFFHQVAIWLTGAVIGVVVSLLVYVGVLHSTPNLLVVIALGIICGGLLVSIFEISIVLWTSLLGALLILISIGLPDSLWLFILLVIAGVGIQEAMKKQFSFESFLENIKEKFQSLREYFVAKKYANKPLCNSCGASISGKDKFCINCGKPIVEIDKEPESFKLIESIADNYCIHCGMKRKPDKDFCRKCGNYF